MDDEQKRLIVELCLGRISRDEFLVRYRTFGDVDATYIDSSLRDSLARKDRDQVEHLLLLGFKFGFPPSVAPVLCELLVEDWHKRHEDIAFTLGKMKYAGAVDCLYHAARAEYSYLDYDDNHALGVKSVYALKAIGTPEAKDRLALLAKAEHPTAAEEAACALKAMQE